jgi:hypothetical protein
MRVVQARSSEDLRRHYGIECTLATPLRRAEVEREYLYRSLYNQLFLSVPDHPQLTMPSDRRAVDRETTRQLGIIRPFLAPAYTVPEIDCRCLPSEHRTGSALPAHVSTCWLPAIASPTVLRAHCHAPGRPDGLGPWV